MEQFVKFSKISNTNPYTSIQVVVRWLVSKNMDMAVLNKYLFSWIIFLWYFKSGVKYMLPYAEQEV